MRSRSESRSHSACLLLAMLGVSALVPFVTAGMLRGHNRKLVDDANQAKCNSWGCEAPGGGNTWVDPLWVEHPNIWWRCSKAGQVALTFDDGPQLPTSGVLKILKELGVTATFFVNGNRIDPNGGWDFASAEFLKQAYASGHQIASHTYSHRNMKGLGTGAAAEVVYKAEIDRLEEVVNHYLAPEGGSITKYIRPPYLALDQDAADMLAKRGYKVIQISMDTNDWRGLDTETMLNTFKTSISSDASMNSYITLQHDTKKNTQGVIKPAVEHILGLGYEIVTVAECVGDSTDPTPPPSPTEAPSPAPVPAPLGTKWTYYWMKFQQESDNIGSKDTDLRTCDGKLLTTTTHEFAAKVRMEGSAYLLNGMLINLGGCDCNGGFNCFMSLNVNTFEWGAGGWDGTKSYPLDPYVSIASNDHPLGSTLRIPALVGQFLPGTSQKHDGCVRVDDVSWSFGSNHLDFFAARKEYYTDLVEMVGKDGTLDYVTEQCVPKKYLIPPPRDGPSPTPEPKPEPEPTPSPTSITARPTAVPTPQPVTDECYATGWDQPSLSSICKAYPADSWQCTCVWDNCKFATLSQCCSQNLWVNQDRCGEVPNPPKPTPPMPCKSVPASACPKMSPRCELGCKKCEIAAPAPCSGHCPQAVCLDKPDPKPVGSCHSIDVRASDVWCQASCEANVKAYPEFCAKNSKQ